MTEGRRALIVEDYQAAAETFKELLEMLGHEADYVTQGADVEPALASKRYDVVFMDINLPDIPGLTLVNHLRERLPQQHMPSFVAFTGFAAADVVGADTIFDAYLEKPLDLPSLERVLQSLS